MELFYHSKVLKLKMLMDLCRVRTLGFLYLNNSDAPGNAGLADQRAAIDWVKTHISAFGGNPRNVTLFGESAGASSIAYQLLIAYGEREPPFSRAILQSASALGQWAFVESAEMLRDSETFWNCTGCSVSNVSCLHSAPALLLTSCGGGMLPTTDFNKLVPDRPAALMAARRFLRVPLIMGVCQNEGSYFVLYNYKNLINYSRSRDAVQGANASDYLDSSWYPEAHGKMAPQVGMIEAYKRFAREERVARNTDAVLDDNLDAIEQIWGDRDFKCPLRAFGHYYALAGVPVYFYLFRHRTSINPWPAWTGMFCLLGLFI